MKIKNGTDESVSWFCFNKQDALKMIALASGDLDRDKDFPYDPPYNGDGWYAVRFTSKGGGTELAIGTVSADGDIMLIKTENGGWVTVGHL